MNQYELDVYTTENCDICNEFPDISNLTNVSELLERYPIGKYFFMKYADSQEHMERALLLLDCLIEIINTKLDD